MEQDQLIQMNIYHCNTSGFELTIEKQIMKTFYKIALLALKKPKKSQFMSYFSLENAAIVKTCHQKKESNEGQSEHSNYSI